MRKVPDAERPSGQHHLEGQRLKDRRSTRPQILPAFFTAALQRVNPWRKPSPTPASNCFRLRLAVRWHQLVGNRGTGTGRGFIWAQLVAASWPPGNKAATAGRAATFSRLSLNRQKQEVSVAGPSNENSLSACKNCELPLILLRKLRYFFVAPGVAGSTGSHLAPVLRNQRQR
jgi:hypothetical protein